MAIIDSLTTLQAQEAILKAKPYSCAIMAIINVVVTTLQNEGFYNIVECDLVISKVVPTLQNEGFYNYITR